jgi:hypothetical protein
MRDALIDVLQQFATAYQVTEHDSQFPILLHFVKKYKIPYLFKWEFGLQQGICTRKHFV